MTEVISKIVNEISEFKPFETQLAEYKKQYENIIYDFSDVKQIDSAKKDKKAVNKVISSLDGIHKEVKAETLAKGRLIDGERKRIKDSLIEIKDKITAQEDEYTNIAIKLAAGLQAKIDEINECAEFGVDIVDLDTVRKILKKASDITVDDSFGSREADGHMAKAKTVELLQGKLLVMEKQEIEALEAKAKAEKEQLEREEQIRKDASAKAELEKEQAAKKAKEDAKLAKEVAEQDKKDAIKAEQVKSKKAELAKEQAAKDLAASKKAEDDKIAADKLKKQNNQKHRSTVHSAIKEQLMLNNFTEGTATDIVKLLMTGLDGKVTINY